MTEFCTLYLVVRDVEQLGRPLEKVITHYLEIVKPSFEQFTLPVRTCILYLCLPFSSLSCMSQILVSLYLIYGFVFYRFCFVI